MKLPLLLAVPTLPVLWLLLQVSDSSPPPPRIPFENMGQVWITLIMFALAIFNYFSTKSRAKQDREWLVEDRDRADKKAKEAAKEIKAEALANAERIRLELKETEERISKEAWRRADDMSNKLDVNTEMTERLATSSGLQPAKKQRRPDDAPPSFERRTSDKPPVEPTRRAEDEPEPEPDKETP